MIRGALFALLLAGCGDSFEEPAPLDLSKNAYDFSAAVDGGPDLAHEHEDFGMGDLAAPPDLTTLTDGALTD